MNVYDDLACFPMNLHVYDGTALALLDEPSVHQMLFCNPKMLPTTATHFEAVAALLAHTSSALFDYQSSPSAVQHIQEKFDATVRNIPRSSHVTIDGADLWRPVMHEAPRKFCKLRVSTACTVPSLIKEIEADEEGLIHTWLAKMRADAKLCMVLDKEGKERRDAPSFAEIIAAIDNSLFRVNGPDRRFNVVGVRRVDVPHCMLLEGALDQLHTEPESLLVDDQLAETVVLFPTSPGLAAMAHQLGAMETLAKRTKGLRIL